MTLYDKNWPWLKFVISPEKLEHILAQVFAELDYRQSVAVGDRAADRADVSAVHLFHGDGP